MKEKKNYTSYMLKVINNLKKNEFCLLKAEIHNEKNENYEIKILRKRKFRINENLFEFEKRFRRIG